MQYDIVGSNLLADAIAAILDGEPRIIALLQQELTSKQEPTPSLAFAEIEKLMVARNLAGARHEVSKLPTGAELERLPTAERYQVYRFRGKVALDDGNYEDASAQFLLAFECCPELPQAKQNRVLALHLNHQHQKAYRAARQYIREGLATPTIFTQLVHSVTTHKQLESNLKLLAPHLATDSNLNEALAHKYLLFGDLNNAEQAVNRALGIASNSPHSVFAAAMVSHNRAVTGNRDQRKLRLDDALHRYNQAEREARAQNFPLLVPEVLVNRGAVNSLLGNESAAAADYRQAVALAADPGHYSLAAVSYFLNQRNYATAATLLEYVDTKAPPGRFQKIVIEYSEASDDNTRRSLLVQMNSLANTAWPKAMEARFQCVHWALLLKDYKAAKAFFPRKIAKSHPFEAAVTRAWIATAEKKPDEATKFVDSAMELGIEKASFQELHLIADILNYLERDEEALPLLERITVPGVLDDATEDLLECAQNLQRHDLILRLCRELRESGQQNDALRKAEARLLGIYSPTASFDLCSESIDKNQNAPFFRCFRNWLAIRLERPDAIDLTANLLPKPAELHPEEAQLVTIPYIQSDKYLDAVEFLYYQLRAHFEVERAHSNYIAMFLQYGPRFAMPSPTRATKESAVLLKIHGDGERWVTIEDQCPAPSRNEVSSDSELGERLLGKRAGEVIYLPGNQIQVEQATIAAIERKYVRAYVDCLENFRTRFPETSFLQKVKVGSDDDFNPEPILESLRQKKAHVEECIAFYQKHPCSLHMFSTGVGGNILEAMKSLANYPNGLIQCTHCSVAEFERLATPMASDNIVLDISAIITLSLLDSWTLLPNDRTFWVSQTTRDLIVGWRQSAIEQVGREGGVMHATDNNRFVYHEYSPEERQAQVDEYSRIIDAVESRCRYSSAMAASEVAPKSRELLHDGLGFHTLEAICLAKEKSALLWTDEKLVSAVAKADFGVSTIWTQLAIRKLCGDLQLPAFERVSAKLVAGNYVSTVWNGSILVAAAMEASWDVAKWPLKQCLSQLSKDFPWQMKAVIARDAFYELRRSNCPEILQTGIMRAVLRAIGSHKVARWLLRILDAQFAVDYQSIQFIRLETEYWLRTQVVSSL